MTVTGKVRKVEMREAAVGILGLDQAGGQVHGQAGGRPADVADPAR
jgi:hypothetical protein